MQSIALQLQRLHTQRHLTYHEVLLLVNEVNKNRPNYSLPQLLGCTDQCVLLMERAT